MQVHILTSANCPQQQSRHFCRIAFIGVNFAISFSSFLFWESRSAPAGLKPISATFVPLLTLARYYIGGSGVLSLLRFHPSLLFCSLELIIVYYVRSFLSIDISHKYVRSFSMFFTVYIVDFSCYTMYIIGKV